MNFSIDARGINLYKGSGIGTYIENLTLELLNIDKKNNYTIFWAGDNFQKYKRKNSKVILTSKKHNLFFENYYYPSILQEYNINLHHIPQNGMGLSNTYNTPSIVTIHDLIPYIMPETVGKGYLERFLTDMPFIIKNCHGILTVSNYSKKDILRFFPNCPEDKIYVTPLASNTLYKPLPKDNCKDYLNKKYKITTPFILYLGGFSKRKNVYELILSFKNILSSLNKNYSLVICGSLKDEGLRLKEITKELLIDDKVIFTDFVVDYDLPYFHNASDLFVYPSSYEGFGLPILEAMSCQTPVITSNTSSIPEVANNSAILIDPFDKSALSEAMLRVLNSPSLLAEYGEKGYKNSLKFTWSNTAKLTLSAYIDILREN